MFVVAGMWCGACGSASNQPVTQTTGANPALPPPQTSVVPVVNTVTAKGWAADQTPVPADGTTVTAFARGLDHPRWIYALPSGDVLVAETNAPDRPEDNKGLKGWFFKRYQKQAGGAVPSANRITLLRDSDGDGIAETKSTLLSGLSSPFGMALVGDTLYVANTDALVKFPYHDGDKTITAPAVKVTDLPAGPINHHWTKNVIASPDGSKLYVSIGSNSNVAENGLEAEHDRAMVWEIDRETGSHRVFASGLRNPVGMAWESGALWVAVNERDELGNDVPPDYMTVIAEGRFYGWPYSYFGSHVDKRVAERPDLVAMARVPDYALGPHVAPLGLASAQGTTLPAQFAEGLFVGLHGSWNRKPFSGYKVIFVPFESGAPTGPPIDVLTGFITQKGEAFGRPVGVALDRGGALLVADDVGNTIWRVAAVRMR
jgi:glucose/arabinose dehydrogenase